MNSSLSVLAPAVQISRRGFVKPVTWFLVAAGTNSTEPVGEHFALQSMYKAGRPIIRKVLKIRMWVVPRSAWAGGSYSSGPPAGGTFVLMSTEYRNQGDVSPCTVDATALLRVFTRSFSEYRRKVSQ